MLVNFIITKIVSLAAGPQGVAIVGQILNLTSIVTSLSSGGVSVGVTKYSAENKSSRFRIGILGSAIFISFFLSIITICLLYFNRDFFSVYFFNDARYSNLFVGYAIVAFPSSLFLLVGSYYNGILKYKFYFLLNYLSVLILLLATVLGYLYSSIYFLYIVIIANTALSFILVALFYNKLRRLILVSIRFASFKYSRKLAGFSLMTLSSIVLMNVFQLLIRKTIVYRLSLNDAGVWEAINRISGAYLSIITLGLSTYYLPFLSAKDDAKIWGAVKSTLSIVFPITLCLSVLIYLCRDTIIVVLFSKSFIVNYKTFLYQLVGDNFKILAFLYAYTMWAKKKIGVFVFSEIFFNISYLCLTIFFSEVSNKLDSFTAAYCINYLLYLIFVFFFVKITFNARAIDR